VDEQVATQRTPSAPGRHDLSRPWAARPDDVRRALGSSEHGLSDDEARRRLRRFGLNRLEHEAATPWWVLAARQFRSPLIYMLIAAAAVTVALGEHLDAALIAGVLLVNALLGYVQEHRAERSLDALRRLASSRAHVLRDGREREIDAAELVPGDIVLIEAGAKVPADGRILRQTAFEVDESLLTGESVAVAKRARAVEPDAAVADRACMVHMGTVATRGHARAVITATGRETELGRVAGAVQAIPRAETPLQQRMGRFTRQIGIVTIACAALGFALGAARGEELSELFRAMVALTVAAPSGARRSRA
jgi:magnesium-transporting ATPase (P-type)